MSVNTLQAQPRRAVNHVATRDGRVRAVCQCCGSQSRGVVADDSGEPDLFELARGWSQAPFPPDFEQRDGSMGSTYTCPMCNAKLRAGETLTLRAYLRPMELAEV